MTTLTKAFHWVKTMLGQGLNNDQNKLRITGTSYKIN